MLYLEEKEQEIPLDKHLWEEPHWIVGLHQLSEKFPLPIVMQNGRDFLGFRKEWNWEVTMKCFKGRKDIFFPCYSLFQDLYWKINWDPACSPSHGIMGTVISMKSLVIFFSQSCLYLTYWRTIKGTGNSTHVQISLLKLPDETREGIRDLADKIKTTRQHRDLTPPVVKNV